MPTRAALLLILAAGAAALDVGVDQPGSWYDPAASHHGRHAAGGAALGALAYEGAALLTTQRDRRIATACAVGLAIGAGWELVEARHAGALADPVDVAWTAAGALAGAALADLTGQAVALAVRREDGGTTVALTLVLAVR